MRDLDEVDLEILRLLLTDGRRPFSEIADAVDLSPPAVSDRVDRLQELGIIRSFTIDVDRGAITNGIEMYLSLRPHTAKVEQMFTDLRTCDEVEHLFKLADGTLRVHAHLPTADAHGWLATVLDLDDVIEFEAIPQTAHEHTAMVHPEGFELSCVVCDNAVGSDGEFARFDGQVKAFCCESCLGRYAEEYATYEEAAD